MLMNEDLTIFVVGHTGMVGSTIYNYYKPFLNLSVNGYSLDNRTCEFEVGAETADIIFECLPTPFDWKTSNFDMSIVTEFLQRLAGLKLKDSCRIVLKSTMPPGSTEKFQELFPNLNLLFNPEFLSEKTAEADFSNPDRQIVGYTKKSYQYATDVLHLLPNSPHDILMTSTEAEIVKYVNNFHGALMITFANFIYDICQKTGASFEAVKKTSQASKWVGSPMGRMYWEVLHGGFRGYGGKCFPKDMNNLLAWVKDQGLPCEVLEAMTEANKRILEEQNLTEQEVEKLSNRVVTK